MPPCSSSQRPRGHGSREDAGMADSNCAANTKVCRSSVCIERTCSSPVVLTSRDDGGGVPRRRGQLQQRQQEERRGGGISLDRRRHRRHRRGPASSSSSSLSSRLRLQWSTTPTFTRALLTAAVLLPAVLALAADAAGFPGGAAASASADAAYHGSGQRQWRRRRLQQSSAASASSSSSGPLPACSSSPAGGEVYAVSSATDAADLAAAMGGCTGGAYNVTWTGGVTLAEPLVVAAASSLWILGAPGADGSPAAIDGGGVTGLVDLGEGSSLRLEGVTLRNASRASGNGGAIRAEAEGCSVVAVDSSFEGNQAASSFYLEGRGGALALGGRGSAELENCVVSGNHAQQSGGGFSTQGDGCSLVLVGCSLEGNRAEVEGGGVVLEGRSTVWLDGSTLLENSAGDQGGGVHGVNATVGVVRGSQLVNNTASYYGGGGISLSGASNLTVSDSSFLDNYYFGDRTFGLGGGVKIIGSYATTTISITDSLFEGNSATDGGGLYISSDYALTVSRTVFHDNVAGFFGGGAVLESNGVAALSSSNFTGGFAWNGGGALEVEGSRVSISDCLFDGNSNKFAGGAIRVEEAAAVSLDGTTFLNNFISSQSGAGSGGAVSVSAGTLTATDCNFENNQAFHDDRYDVETDPLEGGGAVIISDGSNATFSYCNFTLNGGAVGGALLVEGSSTATLSNVAFTSNQAGVYGGALSFYEESVCLMNASHVAANTAAFGGGGMFLSAATGELDGVTFVGNSVSGGSGGAVFFSSGTNATVTGGVFSSNTATGAGGHVVVADAHTNVELLPDAAASGVGTAATPLVLSGGEAGTNGGAVHAYSGAALTAYSVEMSGNRAGGNGGAVSADGARVVVADLCNVTGNSCGGGGGGVSVADAYFVGTATNFSRNAAGSDGGGVRAFTGADVVLEGCAVDGNTAQLGGGVSSVDASLVASRCNVTGNTASTDGGGLRASYLSKVVLDACEVSFNTAGFDGGGVALDASSGTDNDALTAANASSALDCRSGTFEGNRAGERGGAVYVTRESVLAFEGCGSLGNSASLGASVYASHSFVTLSEGSVLANDEVPTGAMVYALSTQLVAWNASFSVDDAPSMLAVEMTSGSSMKALACSFSGWEGPSVVLTGGELEMDLCDFRGSQAEVLVAAMNASSPARIRNTAVGIESYASLVSSGADSTLSRNVMTCSADPCGVSSSSSSSSIDGVGSSGVVSGSAAAAVTTSGGSHRVLSQHRRVSSLGGVHDAKRLGGDSSRPRRVISTASEEDGDFSNQDCVDGNLGVYCPCFVATVTGEEECLGETTTLELEAPSYELLAVGIQGTISSTLNITAGSEGGPVVWKVEEVAEALPIEALTWSIVPNVGILEEGGSATVAITGSLTSDFNGPTHTLFKAESRQSGNTALAMVNTTFYYCQQGEYFNDEECLLCSDLELDGEGLDCDERGVLQSTLPVASGYWRSSDDTTTIRQCLYEEACKGGTVISQSDDYCTVGYHGPYCAVCLSGYAGGISNGCHECTEAFRAGMYLLAVLGGLVALACAWLLFRYLIQEPVSPGRFLSCRNSRMVSKVKELPLHKLKIPIVVFQILTQYADITTVDFPPAFTRLLGFMDVLNLDMGWVLSASCIFSPNFYGRLVLTTLVPIVFGLALCCTFMYAKSRTVRAGLPKANEGSSIRSMNTVVSSSNNSGGGSGGGSGGAPATAVTGTRNGHGMVMSEARQMSVVKSRHVGVLVTASFLVYSTVSTIVFQTFACDTLDELGTTFLRADYSLECYTPEHKLYRGYAGIMILIYPIGIPLLYAWLLFRHRHRIYPKQALRDGVSPERRLVDKKIAHTVLLWQAYRPSRYYYEVIECARRLLLTGCLVFILPNSAGQAGVACVLSVATVALFITLRPFADSNDDRLYILGAILIFLSMFVSLVPKIEIADGDDQSETVVSWLLIVLSLTLWLMAFMQCFWEVRSINAASGSRWDSGDTSSIANLMGNGGFSRRSSVGAGDDKSDGTSSGYKNFSPEDHQNTGHPADFYDFTNGHFGGTSSGGKSNNNVKGGPVFGSGDGGGKRHEHHTGGAAAATVAGGGGGKLHAWGSSPGGTADGRASGYADPVVLRSNDGVKGGDGGGGGGGGGGGATAAVQSSASNQSQSSGNTYGPLTAGMGEETSSKKFPAIRYADDGVADSPTMAEEMFLRRLGGGGGQPQPQPQPQQRQPQQQPTTTTGSAMMYSADSSTMAEDMFTRRLGGGAGRSPSGIGDAPAAATSAAVFSGIDEHGGEEAGRGGGRSLRLSPAEPMANAFPAPMTNAFPASTDTPESEPPGRGCGPRRESDHRKKAAAPLSPSPASSMHLRGPSPAAAGSEMMMPMTFVEGEDSAAAGVGSATAAGGSGGGGFGGGGSGWGAAGGGAYGDGSR